MKRLITAAVGAPLALWALFRLPTGLFFALAAVLFCFPAWEFSRIQGRWAPAAPLWLVVPLVPLTAVALAPGVVVGQPLDGARVLAGLLSLGAAVAVLLARTPVEQAAPAMGALAFGALYLGLPLAALANLQARAPWWLFLLLAVVWIGDSAAFYVGTRFGRRRLAPVVSPKKSWEGGLAAVVASAVVAAVWTAWRDASFDWSLLALAAATSVAAQLGDLVESLLKRGAGVKDSGNLLPGHGGFLDRLDALLFAAPVWWLLLAITGRLAGGES
ncbi:MAG: phosphatidate cytidylyltransferase [Acidobacteriota bacterium]|nr:phosphatidate cytidylyltransferase [Acidobacteriota bacterium]MDH3523242.1 phosphatidate cytidylyltransferase [Acidobacteriota bacterium]